jgi:phage terminase large subunit
LAWEFEYNEDTLSFSKEPLHNWASHPSDAFAYGSQVMQEPAAEAQPEAPRFFEELSIEELWRQSTSPTRSRI